MTLPMLTIENFLSPSLQRLFISYWEMYTLKQLTNTAGQPDSALLFCRPREVVICNQSLRNVLREHLQELAVPEIKKIFNFIPSSYSPALIRSYKISTRYKTRGLRILVSIGAASNAGSSLRFCETDCTQYIINPGCAVVFSGSYIHECTPIHSNKNLILSVTIFNNQHIRHNDIIIKCYQEIGYNIGNLEEYSL